MGSLDSAKEHRALTREEYIATGRSYVENKSDAGRQKRHDIYTEYERYRNWKRSNDQLDINDVVLELIIKLQVARQKGYNGEQAGGWIQMFHAVYLDEIQDFSYASIYLICSIAGWSTLHWVFAGDTAQMISPGCSFKFDGLKEVLLAVKPGIERQVKDVIKLTRNYRVTQDVLEFSNSILAVAKQSFPKDIRYLRPEGAFLLACF